MCRGGVCWLVNRNTKEVGDCCLHLLLHSLGGWLWTAFDPIFLGLSAELWLVSHLLRAARAHSRLHAGSP